MIQSWRLRATMVAMGVLLAIFIGRLFSLQILQGELYLSLADDNRFDRVSIAAPRGVIYDSNGSLLVRNLPAFNVYVTPALLPDSEAEIEAIFVKLAELTGVPLDQPGPPAAACVAGRGIRQLVEEGETNRPFDAWPVACDIDETTARILRQQRIDLPGISVEAVPVLEYPTGYLRRNRVFGPYSGRASRLLGEPGLCRRPGQGRVRRRRIELPGYSRRPKWAETG